MSSPRALGGYYGDISLGTPPQTFTVQFEANCCGSAWVDNFPSGSKHKFYNHSKSSSYVANGTTFGVPESFVSGFTQRSRRTALDGIVSLRRDTTPVDPITSMTLFRRLVESRVLEKPVFTFYLTKGVAGELTIGGFDERHYTDKITVNGNRWLPKEVEALAKIVGANVDNKYEIECSSSSPEIVIVIGGTKFALTKDDYTLRTEGSTVCHWAINSMPEQTDKWILGIPFVEKFYTIFDWGTGIESSTNDRVGIALRA